MRGSCRAEELGRLVGMMSYHNILVSVSYSTVAQILSCEQGC